ncbi:hypothetical protein DYM64_24005 [Salmonella enterica subsp. enterica serovar Schwarzengrund]|nr:hypothetical protein [Salmonella enterica subsp. enterica serovar Schwarzengrund]
MSEEAEERLYWHFLLTHLCGISHRTCRMIKPVYTPLSLRDWVRASPRHPQRALRCAQHPCLE